MPAQRSVASLWRRGGRDDERNDLRDDGTALWSQAGVSHVGEVALGALRAAGSFAAPSAGCAAGAPRADSSPPLETKHLVRFHLTLPPAVGREQPLRAALSYRVRVWAFSAIRG